MRNCIPSSSLLWIPCSLLLLSSQSPDSRTPSHFPLLSRVGLPSAAEGESYSEFDCLFCFVSTLASLWGSERLPPPPASLSFSLFRLRLQLARQTDAAAIVSQGFGGTHTLSLCLRLSHLFPTLVCMCASVLTPGSRERQNVCESVDPVCPDGHQRRRRRQQQQE